jgi:hypothetical protein
VVVEVDSAWICVVLNKNLCTKGLEVVTKEMRKLAGDSFVDFRMVDDGFDGDSYSFLKCNPTIISYMDNFRKNTNVVTVLDSYENPTMLSDEEVVPFVSEEDKEILGTRYGDMVQVLGEGYFSGLHGVVIGGGVEYSEVLFRFHTVTKRERLSNEELILIGNVFKKLKIPLVDVVFSKGDGGKFPVIRKRS